MMNRSCVLPIFMLGILAALNRRTLLTQTRNRITAEKLLENAEKCPTAYRSTDDSPSVTDDNINYFLVAPTRKSGANAVNNRGLSQDMITDKMTEDFVHVAYASENDQFVGMKASIASLLQNSDSPEIIMVHIFVMRPQVDTTSWMTPGADDELGNVELAMPLKNVLHFILSKGAKYKVHVFSPTEVDMFTPQSSITTTTPTSHTSYIRFILHSKLPEISFCLWLDNDTIILGDVVPFVREAHDIHAPIGAFPRSGTILPKSKRSWVKRAITVTEKGNRWITLAEQSPLCNAGVVLMNLTKWRELDCIADLVQYSLWNNKYNLNSNEGFQFPFQLRFGGNKFHHLDSSLYFEASTCKKCKKQPKLKSTLFLQWNGHQKPWMTAGVHFKELWEGYNLTIS